MQIVVEIKNVYGRELIYPVNKTGQMLARLTGTKTFDQSHISVLKELGYSFIQKAKEL